MTIKITALAGIGIGGSGFHAFATQAEITVLKQDPRAVIHSADSILTVGGVFVRSSRI